MSVLFSFRLNFDSLNGKIDRKLELTKGDICQIFTTNLILNLQL